MLRPHDESTGEILPPHEAGKEAVPAHGIGDLLRQVRAGVAHLLQRARSFYRVADMAPNVADVLTPDVEKTILAEFNQEMERARDDMAPEGWYGHYARSLRKAILRGIVDIHFSWLVTGKNEPIAEDVFAHLARSIDPAPHFSTHAD